MDTHTAVASSVLRQYRLDRMDQTPTVLISTASPYKFARDVLAGIAGEEKASGLDAFGASELLEQISGVPMPDQVRRLRDLPVLHRRECDPAGMAQAVLDEFDQR